MYDVRIPLSTWTPLSPPVSGHLELKLEERIGEGASGTTYGAKVLSSSGGEMPKRLCIKWAKGSHCRTLAREAWFYEQLHREGNCEGVITARCYGFFTAQSGSLNEDGNDDLVLKPWTKLRSDDEFFLGDDEEEHEDYYRFFRDKAYLKADSPWMSWSQKSGADRLIAVLLLEELGECYPAPKVDEAELQ